MLKLLEPIWSWTAFAVIIPVIIHLWQVRQGRVLKVGSLLLVRPGARQKAWSRRITEWWLLLLRCLLILLLSFLLTDPVYIRNTPPTAKGWILADKRKFPALYHLYKNRIDSLLQNGYELRSFEPAFTSSSVTAMLNDTTAAANPDSNYWQLLIQAHYKASSAVDLYLFTGNDMQHFSGQRPAINRTVHWYTIPDTTVSGVSAAWRLNNGRVRVVQAIAAPAATIQRYYELSPGGSEAGISVNNEGTQVIYGDRSFPVDTQALRIAIYAKDYPQDGGYLESAIEAISRYTGLRLQVTVANTMQALPVKPDWLFWLSDETRPAGYAEHILSYAKGKSVNAVSMIHGPGFDQPVMVYKIVTTGELAGDELLGWHDNSGKPLLTADQNEYRIYTHFNPAWNNLVWDSGFPEKIWNLIRPEYRVNPDLADHRAIDEQQLQFTATAGIRQVKQDDYRLANFIWLILSGVFAAERFLSLRPAKKGGSA
ncbi:BatA domain-containing protein [Sediminibacterium ginsengisoli]|uniref:N-terminal double-transmembrane domain-containing protein n=1 Tax=Sediminibacterium ginsengisoli TaxID=413434 RepID=A0A1T4RCV9_9BACT|nr:BatA domain-containing protein [Sediminibacterium ginsengisoli]SKA13481.1 N-terminal double-transmembrane domain-containing protein [Sediminibacterium ginsengisoli]